MCDLTLIRTALSQKITLTPEKARLFFKTHAGSYGAHDQFMGVKVPDLRKIAQHFFAASWFMLEDLLASPINEERLLALFILGRRYQKGTPLEQEEIYTFYKKHLARVNNWNLVDASAHVILGAYLWDKDRSVLEELARAKSLWERRISIVSTWYFIRKNDLSWTFKMAEILLNDPEDLIHKATGWMLREAGKRDEEKLKNWLSQHAPLMPRTMLRYAIERFNPETRFFFRSLGCSFKESGTPR